MLQAKSAEVHESLYGKYINPQWVRLLDVLQMNVEYVHCEGAHLQSSDGRRLLDFISGYCVHNAGHNHPRIIAALKQELDARGPAMLQSHVSEQAGELARRLCESAGGHLSRAYFASSGSEAVDSAIKFARAHTRRAGVLYAANGFHGLTCSTLSLMSNPFWKENFGPFLPGVESVEFGRLEQLAAKLAARQFAAFILEPVQAESGIVVPPRDYLQNAQALCRKYGTLLVFDEVQTGMYRCGPFLAAHHFGVQPDIVVLAKAMSGGLVPSAALLMSEAVCDSMYSSLRRAVIHTSTYSENGLAMRAGVATLDVLEQERLGERSTGLGIYLRRRLAEELSSFEMVGEIRGLGLLSGIEFKTPKSLRLRIPFEAFLRIHPAMFGQVLVMRLFRDYGILSQICGNNFMVLKVAPPLVIEEAELEHFISAIAQITKLMHSSAAFWSEALGMARRVVNSI